MKRQIWFDSQGSPKWAYPEHLVYTKGAIRKMYRRLLQLKDFEEPVPKEKQSLFEEILQRRMEKIEKAYWDALTTGRFSL